MFKDEKEFTRQIVGGVPTGIPDRGCIMCRGTEAIT